MSTTRRIAWIDVVKGLMLFFICLSHYGGLPSTVHPFVSPTATYWVPCFIILSGYLYDDHRNMSFREHVLRKTHTLLFPYISFCLLFILIDWNTFLHSDTIYDNLYRAFVTGIGVDKASPLWFVLALYITNVAAYWLEKFWKRPLILGALIALLSILSFIFSEYEFNLPLLIHLLPAALVFFVGGTFIRKVVESESLYGYKHKYLVLLTLWGGGF